MFKKISIVLSTLFGIGYFPFAPGTVGSIVAALVYYFVLPEFIFDNTLYQLLFGILILILSLISIYFIKEAEENLGRDSGKIIIDEFLCYFFAIIFIEKMPMVMIYSLVLFRLFDISKPLGINKLQKLPHGWGVMADDLLAAIYVNLIIHGIYFFRPEFFKII